MRSALTYIPMSAAAALLIVLAACPAGSVGIAGDDMPVGVNVALVPDDTRRVQGTEVQVTFVDVPEYSLCPPRAQCVWAGRVIARFRLRTATGDTTAALEWPTEKPSAVVYGGVKLTLTKVEAVGATPAGTPPGNRPPYRATVVAQRKSDGRGRRAG